MIQAVFFDMDGLLIDSEHFWQQEEKRIFNDLGVPVTGEMQHKTYGWSTDQVIQHWYTYKPWSGMSFSEVKQEIYNRVEERIKKEGRPKEGVYEILHFFTQQNLPIGLISTSPLQLIHPVIEKLQLNNTFTLIHSCELEQYAKPHPAVYLTAAQKVKAEPSFCLVFEDSFVGLIAGLAARMKTVSVPDPKYNHETKYNIADLKINALHQFTPQHFDQFNRTC